MAKQDTQIMIPDEVIMSKIILIRERIELCKQIF